MRSLFATIFLGSLLSTLSIWAKDGDVIRRVNCPDGSNAKLKASPENGRIEVEFEIDDAVPGQRWKIVLKNGGRSILKRTKTVNGVEEINVRALTSDRNGRDKIKAKAVNLATGSTCSVSLRY